ncbi:hypothetical protein HNQ91_002802 [Filimonas zeae]|uniref:DinB-like domain-containing protein n=1 Tax=Filimonas zeae TaxID=1737353 RepID=A0A917J1E1_9BACT|nr:DinB family protein [Filimonas zeae]MDR6339737.1 hypothetical protein [Filimonas zeae]GGH69403.1 hypothetical protein GCM10011379_26670 [Filimonas zeae]
MLQEQPEMWLRGPINGVPAPLQPVAHALLQAAQEITILLTDFPVHLLWQKPAGLASPGFHLQHITGVLDRMYTYAQGQPLTEQQLQYLAAEGKEVPGLEPATLVDALNSAIQLFVQQLSGIDESILTNWRGVGRKQLPSTVGGLLFHAAEHTTRHTGQLLVTVAVLKAG